MQTKIFFLKNNLHVYFAIQRYLPSDQITAVMALKFASNLSFMFTEVPSIIDRYQLAKQAGFKAVESGFPFGFSVQQVATAKKKANIDQVLLNVFTGDVTKGELGFAAIPGLNLVKKINNAHFKLLMDIFHLQHCCGNITKCIQEFLPHVGHIQIAQVPDRHEPDTPGEIDYKYVLSLLETTGYTGYVGLEYRPKSLSAEGLNWIKRYGYTL